MKKAEEGRHKAEDSVHKGIQTPPEREPVNNVQWGLDTLTPLSCGLHVEGVPSSSCLLPSAFLASKSPISPLHSPLPTPHSHQL